MTYLLSLMIFVPIVGIFFVASVKPDEIRTAKNARNVHFISALTEVVLCLVALFYFSLASTHPQFTESFSWLFSYNYILGIDGISLLFLCTISFAFLLFILLDWQEKVKLPKEYTIAFLLLESLSFGVFTALSFSTFIFFFIAFPLPLLFLLKLWTDENEAQKKNYFLIFIPITSLLFLLSSFYLNSGNLLAPTVATLALLFTGAFFPIYSMIKTNRIDTPFAIIGVLSTLPTLLCAYALARTVIISAPFATAFLLYPIVILGLFSAFFFALKSFSQKDFLKVITCFSSSMICIIFTSLFLGFYALPKGALYLCFSYPFVVIALLLCARIIHTRTGSLHIFDICGLFKSMPLFSSLFLITIIAALSFPLTGSFIGFFLTVYQSFTFLPAVPIILIFFMLLTAIYLISTYQKMVEGTPTVPTESLFDLRLKEGLLLLFCLGLIFGLGLFPDWFLKVLHTTNLGGYL